MTIGAVSKFQVPMIITFDENDAEFVCESLANALAHSYEIIEFFQFDPDLDPWDEE